MGLLLLYYGEVCVAVLMELEALEDQRHFIKIRWQVLFFFSFSFSFSFSFLSLSFSFFLILFLFLSFSFSLSLSLLFFPLFLTQYLTSLNLEWQNFGVVFLSVLLVLQTRKT